MSKKIVNVDKQRDKDFNKGMAIDTRTGSESGNSFGNWFRIGWATPETEAEKSIKAMKIILNEVLATFPLIVNDREVKSVDNGNIKAQFFSSPEGSRDNLEGVVELRFRDESNNPQRLRYSRTVINHTVKESLGTNVELWGNWANILKGLVDKSKRQAQIPKTPPGPPIPL